jgi:hypothetical protein
VKLRLNQFIPHKPTPKQAAFLIYEGLEALYGGAAGGGKSDALLIAALQYVDIPDYSAILFRRSYTDLALPGALMDRAHEWLQDTPAKWNRETHSYTFPSGASLTFGYVQTKKDQWRYQSAEFQFIGWDEITEFPDDEAYKFLFSRLRRLAGSEIPLRVRAASNPVGRGAQWVRRRFIEEGHSERIFIPARFTDNPHIDKDSYLLSLQEMHPALQRRLIEGSWDEIEDSAFPEFDESIHVISPLAPPRDWRRWESMDFGVSNPTAWLAAGMDSQERTAVYGEYYQPGLISTHSSRILTLRSLSWGEPTVSVCDPSIRNRTGFGSFGTGETVHSEFAKNGIHLVPANNDRMAGRIRISELLRPDPSLEFPDWHERKGEPGSPRLFFTTNCQNLIEQIKFAPIDQAAGETIDPYWESRSGHALAALRYLVTARVFRPEVSVSAQAGRGIGTWKDWNDWKENQWSSI